MNKAIVTMGLPAAGKSTTLKRDYKEEIENWVIIDPDIEKKNHPKYDPDHPERVHEWSKKQANKKLYNAIADDENIIIDGTGTNAEKMVRYINELHGNGYEVKLIYVTCSLKTSLKRNSERERVVPENIIREKAELISTSFEIVSRYADIVKVVDGE